MIYWLIGFVVLAALIGGAMWLATESGTVTVSWLAYDIILPIGFVLGALLLLLLSASFLTRFALWLVQTPSQLRQEHREASRRKGMRALTKAFTALAANDLDEAEKEAKVLKQHLGHSPLFLLVQSQLAHQKGDVLAARHYYGEMTHHRDTRFLARRGLARDAIQAGHYRAAIDHLQEALRHRPDAVWAWQHLLRLTILEEDWQQADALLKDERARAAFPTKKMTPLHAIIAFERAKKSSDEEERMKLLKEALRKNAALTAAACALAKEWQEQQQNQKARQCLEDGWRAAPHPDLYHHYLTLCSQDDQERLQEIDQLTKAHPNHIESCLARSEVACDANAWQQAEDALTPVLNDNDERVCRLMIRIKESLGIAEEALSWREKMTQSASSPSWQCEACLAQHKSWQAHCGQCGAIATIAWRRSNAKKRKVQPLLATKDIFNEL